MVLGLGRPGPRRCPVAVALIASAWLGSPVPGFAQSKPGPKAHLFVMLGFGDMSPGLREFGAKMKKRGIPTTIGSYTGWETLTGKAIRAYKAGHPIIIVGHSAGGAAARAMAARLDNASIPVRLLVTLAPWTELKVPPNVQRSINIVPTGYENHFTVILAHERELIRYVTAAAGVGPTGKDQTRHAAH